MIEEFYGLLIQEQYKFTGWFNNFYKTTLHAFILILLIYLQVTYYN